MTTSCCDTATCRDIDRLEIYQEHGGFEALEKAVTSMKPDEVTDDGQGLRAARPGRGGLPDRASSGRSSTTRAGRTTSWRMPTNRSRARSRTGRLMESNPFQFLEGVALAAYAVGANAAYVYLRGEFWQNRGLAGPQDRGDGGGGLPGHESLGHAVQSEDPHPPGGRRLHLRGRDRDAGVDRGQRGQPRIRPPFPAVHGLYGKPTVVNNVETLTNLPPIVDNGADWYKTMGTPDSAGVKIFSLSGRVRKPGNYELPFGSTFRELIYEHGGGVLDGRPVRAIMPAGASSSFIVDGRQGAGHAHGLRERSHAGCGPGLGFDDRHRRHRAAGLGDPEDAALLQARVVRQVHAVPRGHVLDAAPYRPGAEPRRRRRRMWRCC